MLTLGELLQQATQRLSMAGICDARRDARLLIGELLEISQATMIGFPETAISADHVGIVNSAIERRVKREPVSRILGQREFFGLPFALGVETLDPRPDSETVVEAALTSIANIQNPKVLDLGTGTGCLLLAVLDAIKTATGLGIDISANAVKTATQNARDLGLDDRADFKQQDWSKAQWQAVLDAPYDLILSNPPYIPDGDIAGLEPEVKDYDPLQALAGGTDGLDPYRLLIPQLPALLTENGQVIFEFGIGQADAVSKLFTDAGMIVVVAPQDLGGIVRCIVARKG